MNTINQIQLKRAVEARCGFPVQSISDAHRLAQRLLENKLYLSGHTIARYWGLLGPQRKHYRTTIEVLCQYAGYHSPEEFQRNARGIHQSPAEFEPGSEQAYQMATLQLSLFAEDYSEVLNISREIISRKDWILHYAASRLVGNFVRHAPCRERWLRELASIKESRSIYYETFVDEDDSGSYFSDALYTYYLPSIRKKELEREVFSYSFILSRRFYSGQAIPDNLVKMCKKLLSVEVQHFHELSRKVEMTGLLSLGRHSSEFEVHSYLETSLLAFETYNEYERAWLLYRTVRPIFYYSLEHYLLTHAGWQKALMQCVTSTKFRLDSVAAHFLNILSYLNGYQEESFSLPQLITDKFCNESHQIRLLNDVVIAGYYEEAKRNHILQGIRRASEMTGQRWVEGLGRMLMR